MIRSSDLARGWDIPKRFIEISLYDGRSGGLSSNKILSFLSDDAKISFQTQSSVTTKSPSATVVITGLTREKMIYLATSYTAWTEQHIINKIIIDAGYENNHGIIFSGEVMEAIPDLSNADFSVSLKCQGKFSLLNDGISSVSFDGKTTVLKIAQKIVEDMNKSETSENERVGLVYYPNREIEITDYKLEDTSPINQMRYLSEISGLDIWLENNRMYIKEQEKPVEKLQTLRIDSSNIVGAPMPDSLGCRIQIRMQPNLQSGMPVELKSKRFEQLNSGKYFIQSYHHIGETKGKKWITEVVLVRTDKWRE